MADASRDIGKDLQARLQNFFDTPLDAAATPLEICQAVLDDVERHVQPVGRGRRVFPYTRIAIRVRQAQPDRAPTRIRLRSLRPQDPRAAGGSALRASAGAGRTGELPAEGAGRLARGPDVRRGLPQGGRDRCRGSQQPRLAAGACRRAEGREPPRAAIRSPGR